MEFGFRVADDNFAAARAHWQLPAGTARLGRVFPGKQGDGMAATTLTPDQLIDVLDRVAAPVVRAGMAPFLSIKPAVPDVLAGRFDGHFVAIGQYARTLPRITPAGMYLTVWHEPQNDPMGANPDDHAARARNYVAVYARAQAIIKGIAGDAVRIGPVDMGYQWRDGMASTAEHVQPLWRIPANLKDFHGLTCYTSLLSLKSGYPLAQRPEMRRWRDWLADDAKILLVERGIAANPPKADGTLVSLCVDQQAATLAMDYAWLASIGAHGLMYWHSDGALDGSTYLLTDAAVEVFRQCAIAAAVTGADDVGRQVAYQRGMADAYADLAGYATVRRGESTPPAAKILAA